MLGKHVIADMYGIPFEALDDQTKLSEVILTAVQTSGATILQHHFEPQGCSGIVLVAESHCCWHSWPEHGVLTLDYFTCGGMDPETAVVEIGKQLGGTPVVKQVIYRGIQSTSFNNTRKRTERHDDSNQQEKRSCSGLLHRRTA